MHILRQAGHNQSLPQNITNEIKTQYRPDARDMPVGIVSVGDVWRSLLVEFQEAAIAILFSAEYLLREASKTTQFLRTKHLTRHATPANPFLVASVQEHPLRLFGAGHEVTHLSAALALMAAGARSISASRLCHSNAGLFFWRVRICCRLQVRDWCSTLR